MNTKNTKPIKPPVSRYCLARLVSAYRGNRNKARWWMQELKRRRSWLGFQGWMVKRHGNFEYGCGARSWRVNGTLCSLWCEASRLKIYYYANGDYSHTDSFELGDKIDNKRAREAVTLLSANNKAKFSHPRDED